MVSATDSNPTRQCGACNACCTVMGVSELNKPAGAACVHLAEQGCAIYSSRPASCHDWFCLWIRDQGRILNDTQRPDRIGIVFTTTRPDATGRQIIEAREAFPDAAASSPAKAAIEHIKQFVPVKVVAFKPQADPLVSMTVDGNRMS